jgi:hypothetical protein
MPKTLYQQTEADILVRPKNLAAHKYTGTKSGRDYGRISSSRVLYIDPADFKESQFVKVKDWQGGDNPNVGIDRHLIGRTPKAEQAAQERAARIAARIAARAAQDAPEMAEAARRAAAYLRNEAGLPNDTRSTASGLEVGRIPVAPIDAEGVDLSNAMDVERLIRRAGTRLHMEGGRYVVNGFDIEANPSELADFIAWVHRVYDVDAPDDPEDEGDHRPRLLEIGSGESAGLARLFSLFGWQVVTVNATEVNPSPAIEGDWQFVKGDSRKVDDTGPLAGDFDLIIISDSAARADDWQRFAERAPVVVATSIVDNEWWNGLAKGPKGGLKKGYREFVAPAEAGVKSYGIGIFTHE